MATDHLATGSKLEPLGGGLTGLKLEFQLLSSRQKNLPEDAITEAATVIAAPPTLSSPASVAVLRALPTQPFIEAGDHRLQAANLLAVATDLRFAAQP
jgi:hypothetical protein